MKTYCVDEDKVIDNYNLIMETIESAQAFLDQQARVAIWYTEYEGRDETIRYANPCFSEAFNISIDDILEKKKYHLVNPPDTSEEVIEQYKDEDIAAMRDGCFLSRSPAEPGKDIEVVKLRFDQGMLGLFKVVDAEPDVGKISLQNLNVELQGIIQAMANGQLKIKKEC